MNLVSYLKYATIKCNNYKYCIQLLGAEVPLQNQVTHKNTAHPNVSHHSHDKSRLIKIRQQSLLFNTTIGSSEQFRSVSYQLHISISFSLIKVSMKLNAMGLISQSLNDEMIDDHKNPSVKAAKLVSELQKTLNAHPNPKAYLIEVCTALKGIGEEQITDAVNRMGVIHDHQYKGVYCKLCDDYHLKPEDIQQEVPSKSFVMQLDNCIDNKSPPDMADLVNLVAAKIQDKFYQFGTALHLDDSFLRSLCDTYHNPMDRFIAVFNRWKDNDSDTYTWGTVIKVLQSDAIGAHGVAQDVMKHLTTIPD